MKYLVKVSHVKLIVAALPTVIFCGWIGALLFANMIRAGSEILQHRSFFSGSVGIILCGLILIFILISFISIIVNKNYGIFEKDGYLYYFSNVYRKVNVNEIENFSVNNSYLFPRLYINLKDGSGRVVMSNVMVGRAQDMADRLNKMVLSG
ncbi:MAG: hypothetical protein EON91_01610 [Brevundimonas sp.]|uniref:hypothetical protein n=1 Tax=Brevundimonas sp. TaxID=1871086 RepID=UPI0011F4C298|nr:hypothetical protein [Brevundimonas sp.]RZJ19408.1 MAG: hypothetical protein EON91_01610 [Brevundimonas sp.]